MYFAEDGSASAYASVQLYALGYLGIVRFAVDSKSGSAIRHECIRHRDTRAEALQDARADAHELVRRWVEDRVHIDDL
ncbi:MAG: hypothetical protein DI603_23455 [Roseateles depolymerans]|uniref:Uncharacterized protein n=1 Tax=Roseateles depolymerans TaxID=76731 RepID=A0A2W5DBR4_9BURK|nr:MAG: hypothetical protein DI603_23455 [Roseateles depolymerans]